MEYVEYDGNLYGSSYESLERAWQKAPVATIVLDTKGAETYLERIPEKTEVVYLCVTDEKVQRERMEQRGDDADKIRRRLASQEAKRDKHLPNKLVKHVHVIENDEQLADFCEFGQDFEVVCFDAEILSKLIYLSGQMNYNN